MMKKVIYAILAIAMATAVCGCETVKGVGKDVQKAGDKIEKAAN